ncbi:hypothetical protein Y032_0224g2739 [Ancylostoma ceylanicum]|uniref:Uncharacterized protein n=1 Tax=Ancylostoma ceylanicum TaxID=53326 RepID=A0A016SIF7_9BILA|nr:hypothetical protein Y032_0224g2739 [Ancylostoma ceylanicum]
MSIVGSCRYVIGSTMYFVLLHVTMFSIASACNSKKRMNKSIFSKSRNKQAKRGPYNDRAKANKKKCPQKPKASSSQRKSDSPMALPTAKTQDSEKKLHDIPTSPADHKTPTVSKSRDSKLVVSDMNSLDLAGKKDFDDYLNALGEADGQGDAEEKGAIPAPIRTSLRPKKKEKAHSAFIRNTMENVPTISARN